MEMTYSISSELYQQQQNAAFARTICHTDWQVRTAEQQDVDVKPAKIGTTACSCSWPRLKRDFGFWLAPCQAECLHHLGSPGCGETLTGNFALQSFWASKHSGLWTADGQELSTVCPDLVLSHEGPEAKDQIPLHGSAIASAAPWLEKSKLRKTRGATPSALHLQLKALVYLI
ncbi:unnamed protein product [Symbiodinium natans]|uniref:Uncharacterized protein n=1 Tax=Symbiodinium natans TaxID=878477 RepID=A0A812R1T0_9DINO|nr:unnamed protein product [Symbiodinium natans]